MKESQGIDGDREIWDRKAQFWDALHGDAGNLFHRRLIEPSVLQLLDLRAGEPVLDVACGNGALARRLAALGARVTAIDFSPQLIGLARQRGSTGAPIDYRVVDACDEDALLRLGARQFSAITCTMALMDMPAIAPLFRAASQLLQRAGQAGLCQRAPSLQLQQPDFCARKSRP